MSNSKAAAIAFAFFFAAFRSPMASAQTPPPQSESTQDWGILVSGAGIGSPGLGSGKAVGVGAGVALTRFRDFPWVGVVAQTDLLWDATAERGEQWFLAGAEFHPRSGAGAGRFQVLGGVKRLSTTHVAGQEQGSRLYPAFGVEAGVSTGVFLAVDLRVAPSDPLGRYRLMFRAGVELPVFAF